MRDKDDIESRRFEKIRLSHQLGEYVGEFTTIFGVTPCHPKAQKLMDKLIDDFLYGDKDERKS